MVDDDMNDGMMDDDPMNNDTMYDDTPDDDIMHDDMLYDDAPYENFPRTRWFKNSLLAVTIEATLIGILAGIGLVMAFISLIASNGGWSGLGAMIALFGAILISSLAAPIVLTAVSGRKYIKGEAVDGVKRCIFWTRISMVVNLLVILFFTLNYLQTGSTSFRDNTTMVKVLFFAISFFITEAPLSFFMAGCLLEEGNKNAKYVAFVPAAIIVGVIVIAFIPIIPFDIGVEKIPGSEANLHTLGEFNQILRDRGFVYDYEPGMSELTHVKQISAVEPGYEYERDYSVGYDKDLDKKFSFYTYDGYASLIEKSSKTAKYYTKGPEDWWILWDIYDSNGQIFAAVSEESKKDTSWTDSIFKRSPIQIVAEKSEITTYNWGGDYFVEGGCISDTKSTITRRSFPEMHDVASGNNCGKVYVVDKVDAETLDALAKKIAKK